MLAKLMFQILVHKKKNTEVYGKLVLIFDV